MATQISIQEISSTSSHAEHPGNYTTKADALEPIAIIGFALKYPQDATTPQAFWKMLEEKKCAMTAWPKDRINLKAFHNDNDHEENNTFVPGAHFLKQDLGAFDASFFGLSAQEAMAIDPQHRILLETAYHALENAGITMDSVYGSKTGVYSGSMTDDYKTLITKDVEDMPRYTATGVSMNMVANRLSWFFNFTGPSVNMDSACSSSLMALDFACQGLRSRDSSMALVAGASMILAIEGVLSLMNMNFLSPDGRCYSFDERANGYARGEGVGVVLIKRLSDAVKDGNIIRAVIRATGSNQDGHTAGVTQPNRDAQARLIRETYSKANLGYSSTRFFEAHGTGTPIGDPIEAAAIGSSFASCRGPDDPLFIGAVKGNIGHLEGGSGIAGLIKTVMVLEKGVIPPNANFEHVNPSIDATFLNLKFPTEVTAWPTEGLRRASVASFGFGGSNAHVILDDAYHYLSSRDLCARHCTLAWPPFLGDHSVERTVSDIDTSLMQPSFRSTLEPNELTRYVSPVQGFDTDMPSVSATGNLATNGVNGASTMSPTNGINDALANPSTTGINGASIKYEKSRILVWSAADEAGLQRLARLWQEYFSRSERARLPDKDDYLSGLAHTLAFHRTSLPWKSYAIIDCRANLTEVKERMSKPIQSSRHHGLGFIFTGQGAQYSKMGAELMSYPVFRLTLEAFDKVLYDLGCPWSIFDEICRDGSSTHIHDPEYSQPLTTALQIGLFELLRDFRLSPSVVVGHSSGEIAAAYAAGGLSFDSACKVSYYRGQLTSSLRNSGRTAGAMLSVDRSEQEMRTYLQQRETSRQEGALHIACINSPQNVTVSGYEKDIDILKTELETKGVPAHKLKTGVAYHSPHMRAISAEYERCLQDLTKSTDSLSQHVQMISSTTGESIQDLGILSKAAYWVKNMVQPVKFSPALTQVVSRSRRTRKLGARAEDLVHDLVEIGPHPALRRAVKVIIEGVSSTSAAISYSYTLSREKPAAEALLQLAGSLWSIGYPIALDKANHVALDGASKPNFMIDLPEYPFDHSKIYWCESEMSKHTRLRRHERLELLGTPVSDWNALEPRWRKFFNIAETPWIEDHQVNGKAIYPATGMVVMAIEGATQIAERGRRIVAYAIKDATFSHPIIVDDTARTEVQLFMRPNKLLSNKNIASSEYRICIRQGSEWRENCRGLIQVEFETAKNELESDQKSIRREQYYQDKFEKARVACSRLVETDRMYDQFRKNRLNYGPAFRALDDLAWDGTSGSVGKIRTFQWTSQQSQHQRQGHVVHPVTLDAAGQLMWVALTKGATEVVVNGAAVTRIREAWISGTGLSYPDSTYLQAYSTSALKGLRGTDSSMFALNHLGQVKLVISHMETTSVSGSGATTESPARRICYGLDWQPDLACLTADEILSFCKTTVADMPEPTCFYQDLTLVLLYFIRKTLHYMNDRRVIPAKPHLRKHLAWLTMQASKYELREGSASEVDWLSRVEDEGSMVSLVQRIEDAGPEGRLYVTVGRNLPSIIEGSLSPLEVMFRDGLAEAHYQDMCNRIPSCRHLRNFLRACAHKNPTMKILEIGAGTGSFTSHILAPLLRSENKEDEARLSQYDYTDISESFLENARNKFASMKSYMNFGLLNIENSPGNQGYGLGTYDMVVAGWVLHATPSLDVTVQNVRKLLRPGGKLIMLEITQPDILRNGFAFGTLSDWWLGTEECRTWSPCVSESQWQQILVKNGFSGVDSTLPDYESEACHESSIIIATAGAEPTHSPRQQSLHVVIDPQCPEQALVADCIGKSCSEAANQECEIISFDKLSSCTHNEDRTLLFLLELNRPTLYDLQETEFYTLRHALKAHKRVIWATAARTTSSKYADVGMVQGLARVLTTEESSLSIVTVALEDHKEDPQIWVKHIVQVLDLTTSPRGGTSELEYVERNGILMIGRVAEASELNYDLHARATATTRLQIYEGATPLVLAVGNPGSLDSLHFVEDVRYATELQPDHVEISVKAIGVNFRDLLVALGKHNADTIGCECSGIVTRVGSNCTTVHPGDRVCAVIIGCIYTYARCHYQLAAKIPDEISFTQAASLPVTGVTAHYSLSTIARLRREDSILIHSGAGGTGQMAVQIAQSIGCEVFVTVGSREKRQLMADIYHIPEGHILYSRDTSFAKDIMRVTQGKGVDVVLNSLSGEGLTASWESIAPFGRFIELGKADIEENAKLSMAYFANNVSFSAIAIDHITASRPSVIRESLLHILGRVADGSLKVASPLHEFPISDIEGAFRFMQSGMNAGKIVLNTESGNKVPALLRHKPSYTFDKDATYMIAGGLGGLGRSAARWMAGRGARNLILLSRSGPKATAALELLDELRDSGVRVETPLCDVSSAESLSAILKQYKELPPIKGCLQSTMVLKDSIFENMTFSDWTFSIRSKVHSTWNLHRLLPPHLSFFIMLSSVAGIAGSPSQANYAAGNTFQDALAQHRHALGLKATSIDLGVMADVGIVAENEAYARGKEAAADLATIRETEFLALLDYYCDPALEVDRPWKRQPIIGLVTPGEFRAKGMDLPDWIERPMFRTLPQSERFSSEADTTDGKGGTARDFAAELLLAADGSQAVEIVTAALLQKLAKALALAELEIDVRRPLHTYGVDSLLAIELRNWFTKVFKVDVAVLDITGQRSIEGLVHHTVERNELGMKEAQR